MTYSDLLDYFKEHFSDDIKDFYIFNRDDKKEKSLSIYAINGIGTPDELGNDKVAHAFGAQVQLVFTNSAKESEKAIRKLAKLVNDNNCEIRSINDKEFYMRNLNGEDSIHYFGLNASGNFYWGIDLIIYY